MDNEPRINLFAADKIIALVACSTQQKLMEFLRYLLAFFKMPIIYKFAPLSFSYIIKSHNIMVEGGLIFLLNVDFSQLPRIAIINDANRP